MNTNNLPQENSLILGSLWPTHGDNKTTRQRIQNKFFNATTFGERTVVFSNPWGGKSDNEQLKGFCIFSQQLSPHYNHVYPITYYKNKNKKRIKLQRDKTEARKRNVNIIF